MKNIPFDFHGVKMSIKVTTLESNGKYTVLDAMHPPNVGPALHMHPRGPEIFFVMDGDYEFILDDKPTMIKTGDVISIPKGVPHRFVTGSNGGRVLIISPPDLEHYFFQVSQLLAKGEVSWKTELEIANQYGQIFLDNTKHWRYGYNLK